MAATQSIDDLITALEHSVEVGLAHFRRLEAESKIKMGHVGPRETLCQLVWWHQASVEGLEAIGAGKPPNRIYASTDEMNARALGRLAGQSVAQLIEKVEHFQARLENAARALPDPGATVFVHGNGSEDSAQQRLEAMRLHWNACSEALQAL